jgi:hypothetical protein
MCARRAAAEKQKEVGGVKRGKRIIPSAPETSI